MDLEEGTQEAPSVPAKETREAPSDREDEAQGTPSDPEEETLEAPSDPEEETPEAPSDSEETKDVAGLAEGPTDLEGSVVPKRRKLTISGNFGQIMSRHTWSRRVHAGVEGAAPQSSLSTNEEGD